MEATISNLPDFNKVRLNIRDMNYKFWREIVQAINSVDNPIELQEEMQRVFTKKIKYRELLFRYAFDEKGMIVMFGDEEALRVLFDVKELFMDLDNLL